MSSAHPAPRRGALRSAAGLLLALTTAAAAAAAADPYQAINAAAAADPIVATPLRGGVTMLSGSGGNIGVITGRDGVLMVDAGIAVSQAKIVAALRRLSAGRLRYVVTTHWHWDHTDGDGWARRAGAVVLADPHVIRRLTQSIRIDEWNHTFTPVPTADLPDVAVPHDRTLRIDGERIRIRHYPAGHTDGDLSVYFEKADVLATGDTFWNGVFPFLDYATGAGIDGAIRQAEANLALVGPQTQVIPGHGPVGDRADLLAFRDMLVTVRGRVAALKADGETVEQVIAARPTADLDERWGGSVISGALFTRVVYRGV